MIFANVEQAVEWLATQSNKNPRSGNAKVEAAMAYLNHPEKDLPVITITGTNGKGSVASYLKNLLLSQGLKVGTFTSPHIMRINERITFNGEEISDQDLKCIIERMYDVNEYLANTEHGRLVYFENYTVMMGLYFQMKQPDVIICEVGIGGFSDATQVYDAQMALITTIGLDHTEKLGHTIAEVAYEKSGIIKKGASVITGRLPEEAMPIIQSKVVDEGAKWYRFDQEFGYDSVQRVGYEGSDFQYYLHTDSSTIRNPWHIGMLGTYQIDNAVVALTAFYEWMHQHHHPIDDSSAKVALAQTQWMARMERMHTNPLIYIDGAHNKHGLLALKTMVEEYFSDWKVTLLYAGLSRKDQANQLRVLDSFSTDTVYLTTFGHYEAMTLTEFEDVIEEENLPKNHYHMVEDWRDWLHHQMEDEASKHLVLVTGSLYFVSDVRKFFMAPKG